MLTSGRERSVLDGAPLIKDLVARAAGRIQVMACGGVRADNAHRVVAATGVRDLHAAPRLPASTTSGPTRPPSPRCARSGECREPAGRCIACPEPVDRVVHPPVTRS